MRLEMELDLAYKMEFSDADVKKASEEVARLRRQMELSGELAVQVLQHARPYLMNEFIGRKVSSDLLDRILVRLKKTMFELDIEGWQPELRQIELGRFEFKLTPIGGWSSESWQRTFEGTTISAGPPYCCFSIS